MDAATPPRGKRSVRDVMEAIADLDPVDWDAALGSPPSGRTPEETQDLRHLRMIEQVSASRRQALDRALESSLLATSSTNPTATTTRPTLLFRWGRLEVLELIGEGSRARVYRAHDPELGRDVALKLTHRDPRDVPQARRWLLEEGRKLSRVEHPNVVRVRGTAVNDGQAGLWTDLIHGRTLADRGTEDGPLSASEAARVGIDLCGALAALHAQGLVHCDLKPANVMRETKGRIVLTDFGSAEYVRIASSPFPRVVSGTPLTMAPEVLVDEQEPTPAADIYGLGVLLYWLVCGRYPVEAQDLDELKERHRRGERVPLVNVRPDVPEWFAAAIEHAIEPSPVRRFPSVGHMQRALRDSVAPVDVSPVSRGRWWKAHRKAVSIAVTTIVAMAVGSATVWSALAPLRVEATFFHSSAGTTRPVVDGARISGGDELFLEVRGSRAMHVWLLNEDSSGNVHVLYPLAGASPPPLRSNTAHRLPPDSNWVVSDEGGAETLFFVAARRRLGDLEALLADVPRVRPDSQAEGFRSVQGVTRSLAPGASSKLLDQLEQILSGRFGLVTLRLRLVKEGGS